MDDTERDFLTDKHSGSVNQPHECAGLKAVKSIPKRLMKLDCCLSGAFRIRNFILQTSVKLAKDLMNTMLLYNPIKQSAK